MDGSLQPVTDLENSVGARCTIPAGGLEAARVNDQPIGNPVACRSVGVTVYHAVGFRKQVPERGFNVEAQSGTMGKSDAESIELEAEPLRQGAVGAAVAHVAVHRVHGFVAKGAQQRNIRQVACMDNGVAVSKAVLHKILKMDVWSHHVGI